MTFFDGVLELMSPSKLHERIARLLNRFIAAWTEERGVAIQSCGSMTFQRDDLNRGMEPDECYYIRHEAEVRRREDLDLSFDPPPDLVVEVDVSSPSRNRLPLYAALNVPEVWLWRDDKLRFLKLDESGGYSERDQSASLPGFPRKTVEHLLEARCDTDETTLVKDFRRAVRDANA
jgi:Uma2 family endonuclease